jgi:hypothetical protein
MKPNRLILFALCAAVVGGSIRAQQDSIAPQGRTFVTFTAMNRVIVAPGHSTPVQFTFHVQDGYHINSNKPMAEELIPTQIHFSLPGEMIVGRLRYPAGALTSFPFDPTQKLSVYSGNFVVNGLLVAPTSANSGPYTVHAELKYQACDNNACYPPKKLPFTFEVTIGKRSAATNKARPTKTSPHIHN